MLYQMMITIVGLIGAAGATDFNDHALAEMLKSKCVGQRHCLIYTWSPHMPLSIRGRGPAEAWTKANRVNLISLVDPNASPKLIESVRRDQGWASDTVRQVTARELIYRGVRVHYPTYQFASEGKLKGPLVPGVRHAKELGRLAKTYLPSKNRL